RRDGGRKRWTPCVIGASRARRDFASIQFVGDRTIRERARERLRALEECKQKCFGCRAMRPTTLAFALCAVLLAACKQSSTDQQQQPAQGASPAASAPSGSEIVIGATLPLTGSEARIGAFYKEGYDLAFEEANQGGGISVGGKKMH